MITFESAVRESLFARIVTALVAGSDDLSVYPSLPLAEDGGYRIEHDGVAFEIVMKVKGETLSSPAVNVIFVESIDLAPGRLAKKRYALATTIEIIRPLDASETAPLAEQSVRGLAAVVSDVLADGRVRIWTFGDTSSAPTLWSAEWVGQTLSWENESDAVEGGDIRLALDFAPEYVAQSAWLEN